MQETIIEEKGDTFFLERGDGFVFACGELEAWNTLRNRSTWQRRDFKLIGTSDGSTFKRVIAEAKHDEAEMKARLKELRTKLERYTETEERMLYTDLLEETDPKVVRVRELRAQTLKEIEPLEDNIRAFSSQLIQRAFDAELEVAKLTPRMPKNRDIEVGDSSKKNAEKVLKAMGRKY